MNRFPFFIAYLLVFAIATPVSAQINLPDIGDSSESVFTQRKEEELAGAFLRELREQVSFVEDPEIVRYVRNIGAKLAAAGDNAEQAFHFYVIDNENINAFAGPGGIIGVNTGLLLESRSESEFAAVLAHEIAHVTQKHLARTIENISDSSLPTFASIFAALILSSQNSQVGQAALAGVLAGSSKRHIDFTRGYEEEADRVGIELLARAEFNPHAMPSFFETLQKTNRFRSEAPEFLSTHPVTSKRIADSRNRAEQYPYRRYANSLDYSFIKAKLQAISAVSPAKAIEYFEKNLRAGQIEDQRGAQYGYAIALIRAKKFAEAKTQLMEYLADDPDRVNYLAALAYTEEQLSHLEEALTIYRNALRIYPNDLILTPAYTQALLNSGRPSEALKVLERYGEYQTPTAKYFTMLAHAHSALGNRFSANVALAESHYLKGDLQDALHAIGMALRQKPPNNYSLTRARARLELYETEQRERLGRKRFN